MTDLMPGHESRFATPHGEARTLTARAHHSVATLLLSHGAGGGVNTRDLVALAEALPRNGVTVVCFEQPWVLAGRKVATPPPTLDDGLRAAAGRLRSKAPLIVGGRSAAYEEELENSRTSALQEIRDRAQRMGADAIVGLQLDFEVIGSRGAMIMVTAVGTAVRLKKL